MVVTAMRERYKALKFKPFNAYQSSGDKEGCLNVNDLDTVSRCAEHSPAEPTKKAQVSEGAWRAWHQEKGKSTAKYVILTLGPNHRDVEMITERADYSKDTAKGKKDGKKDK